MNTQLTDYDQHREAWDAFKDKIAEIAQADGRNARDLAVHLSAELAKGKLGTRSVSPDIVRALIAHGLNLVIADYYLGQAGEGEGWADDVMKFYNAVCGY